MYHHWEHTHTHTHTHTGIAVTVFFRHLFIIYHFWIPSQKKKKKNKAERVRHEMRLTSYLSLTLLLSGPYCIIYLLL